MSLILGNTALQSVRRNPEDRQDADPARLVDYADASLVLRSQHVDIYSDLSGGQRDVLWAKREWLQAVWAEYERIKAGRGGSLEDAVTAVSISRPGLAAELSHAGKKGADARTVRNAREWIRKLGKKRGKPDWRNIAALAPRSGGRQASDISEFMRPVLRLYLDPRDNALAACRRKVARVWRRHGREDEIPSIDQVRHYVRTRISPTVLIKYRGGREEYANRQRGYIPRELNMEPGEVWFADHRIADFWVRCPHPDNPDEWLAVRPWVTAIQDARSGYMVAMTIYCDQAPNHERILETYQNAVIAAGWTLPRVWYHDQGKDYLKQGVVEDAVLRTHDGTLLCGPDGEPYRYSVMRALRVRDKPARGYNGKEKPVERGFGTEANDFDRTQPGYCGNAPGNRPDQRDTWEGDVMRLPTQEQARRQLDDWLRNEHHLREREDGKSIQDMWDGRPEAPEREVTERDLFMGLLMPHAQARKVDRSAAGTGGVRFAGWTYSHVSLRGWRGKNVMIKTYWGTPRVTRKRRSVPAGVFVYSPDDVLICLAVADGTADMIADTEEAKARLGELQHLINASAKLDTDEFEQHTGTRRLGGADGVMRMLPAWGGTGGAAVVADAQNTRPARRVKGRPAARPAIAAPAEDISDFHAAINEAARLQQDDDRADAPLEFPGAAPAGRQEQGQPAEADGFLGGLMNAEQEDDPYAD